MTSDRFRTCLSTLHWSQRAIATIVGVDERQVRRWATGQYAIPLDIADWLESLTGLFARHPPPTRRPAS